MKQMINTLEEALILDLETLYAAEGKLKSKLGTVIGLIQSKRLRTLFVDYLGTCQNKRLMMDRIFSYLNREPKGCATAVMDELIEDIFKHISFANQLPVQDLLLANCLQRINNYKRSLYQSSMRYAEALDLETPVELLSTIIEWELETKESLSDISVACTNNCFTAVEA